MPLHLRAVQHAARPIPLAAACAILAAPFAAAQTQQGAPGGAPSAPPNAPSDVAALMQRTLAVYGAAKSYDAEWSYTIQRGQAVQKMTMTIKKKGPARLYFLLGSASDYKGAAAGAAGGAQPQSSVPAALIVIDGKNAWSENLTTREYYRVPEPKDAQLSPLMFIPHLASIGQVHKRDNAAGSAPGATTLEASSQYGGTVRMEIDNATGRIRRLESDNSNGALKLTSIITVDRETFDGEVPDSAFQFRPESAAREIPAPPEAAALFGQPAQSQGAAGQSHG